jgi:hypothetical protein
MSRMEQVTKTEADMLKSEIDGMKSENREIIEQLKDMKVRYALELENKNENELSLIDEIRLLHSKLGRDEPKRLDSNRQSKDDYDSLSAKPDNMYKDGYTKPLSEDGESNHGMSENISYRKRRYHQKE